MPAAIPEIEDPALAKGDVAGHAGGAKREGDVVAGPKMFLEEGSEREIGQDVAAVDEEILRAEERFGVLDSAASFEQDRLVHERDRSLAIGGFAQRNLEFFGQVMGVDDERFHAQRDEMIEREGDERLAENRDERLGQVIGERTEPFAKTGAEDKSLGDHLPNERCCSRFPRTALHRATGLRCQIGPAGSSG